nr:WBP2 N-terminal like [Rousettus aegyptiacus]
MFSFMMPFDLMSNCTVEQPVFAPNCIKGTIQAAPDGGWEGQATFKLAFRKGGAIEFAQLMSKAASAAARGVPLGSVSYWFGSPGLYVITRQGGTICNQEVPCPAYPFIVYGPQPMRYAAPPGGYRAPPAGYGAPPAGYGAPPVGYGAPPAGYVAPPEGSEAPLAGYGAPSAGYGAPPAGYRAPPAGYEAPPPGYEAPPAGYGLPPVGYGTPPAGNEAPPSGHEAPPAGSKAGSQEAMSAQPAGYEASAPSASSSRDPSPSKK